MSLKNKIENFNHLPGHNCVTTALRNIINYYGYRYPESMIFGLAEGLGFQFLIGDGMENPFLGGVGKGLIESFCRNLDLKYDIAEFDSDTEAMDDLKDHIDRQIPVMVQVDLFFLPYFQSSLHFAAHRLIAVAYDEANVYCADTGFRHLQPCPIDRFIEARRTAYPPFAPNRRRVRIEKIDVKPFVEEMVTKSLYNLERKFESGQPGYDLRQIFELRDHLDAYKSPATLYTQIEKAGTGGGLSRRLFADFLDQAGQMYSRSVYEQAAELYSNSAALWSEIALAAKQGNLKGEASKLEEIYQIESEAIKTFGKFEAEEL